MTVAQLLADAPLARLDAELLLAHILGKDRAWLYAHGEHRLSPAALKGWSEFSARRQNSEPVAYLTGEQEFFGKPFSVTRDVLIPRPSTEGLVELAIDVLKGECGNGVREVDEGIAAFSHAFGVPTVGETIVDIGTGSGCIAVSLALSLPRSRIVAVDVSEDALRVGRANAKRHKVDDRITFICDDGPAVIKTFVGAFVVVSNPPYIPDGQSATLMRSVAAFEPHLALFAGPDGLAVLEPLLHSAKRNPHCMAIAVECRQDQVERLQSIVR